MSLTEMFNTNANTDAAANARSLAGTAQLTTVATTVANAVIKAAEDNFEQYKDLVAKSKVEHGAMDQLIAATYDLSTVDIEFLKALDETTLDNMLKSQQSKRSRSKGKIMTMENYRAMMTGAIAENLIRLATGKSKFATGTNRLAGSLEYTVEQLADLANNPEALRKEIRNVQSKKSIMKSKEDFSEDDERWQALLQAEELLKGLRTETKTVIVDETKAKLIEIFVGIDLDTLDGEKAYEMLWRIKALIETSAPVEEHDDETPPATTQDEHEAAASEAAANSAENLQSTETDEAPDVENNGDDEPTEGLFSKAAQRKNKH